MINFKGRCVRNWPHNRDILSALTCIPKYMEYPPSGLRLSQCNSPLANKIMLSAERFTPEQRCYHTSKSGHNTVS
jgi:hypothetical protein